MKRLLCLSLCILLGGVRAASAEVVIGVTPTRSSYDTAWDRVDLHIQSIDGAIMWPGGGGITAMAGTWTANAGTFNLPGTSATWAGNIHNWDDLTPGAAGDIPDTGPPPPNTYVNMLNLTADVPWRHKVDGTAGGATTSQSFYAGWAIHPVGPDDIAYFALSPRDLTPGDSLYWNGDDYAWEEYPGYGFDNTLLGTFYVSKATQWTPGQSIFTGLAYYPAMDVFDYSATVRIVPEPSTLGLLCCGLFVLFAHATRKQR